MQLITTDVAELKKELAAEVVNQLTAIMQQAQPATPSIEFITRQDAAKLLGVSLATLLDWTKSGIITGYRINTRVRYKRHELEQSVTKMNMGRATA